MTEEQALNILFNAAAQAKLSRSDHALVEQSQITLAESLGLAVQPPPEEVEPDNG